jgi:hypothetical protein
MKKNARLPSVEVFLTNQISPIWLKDFTPQLFRLAPLQYTNLKFGSSQVYFGRKEQLGKRIFLKNQFKNGLQRIALNTLLSKRVQICSALLPNFLI